MRIEPREIMERSATWSGEHMRETLVRRWDRSKPLGVFIGSNPGEASAEWDDQTSIKYVGFARRWGWGGYVAGNLFQWVATNQGDLGRRVRLGQEVNPMEPDLWLRLFDVLPPMPPICCAWGRAPMEIRGPWARRLRQIKRVLDALTGGAPLLCAGMNKDGSPVHLSRYPYTDRPMEWNYQGAT